jgi:hypothetical protein
VKDSNVGGRHVLGAHRAAGIAARRHAKGVERAGRRQGDELLEHYLPAPFRLRLPEGEASWRGRTVLLLWALGYPLEMAWSLGMTADAEQASTFEELISRLDDQRLVAQLDASADIRGDGSHIEFLSFGMIRKREST